MEDEFNTSMEVLFKIADDPFAISIGEAKDTSNKMIDLMYNVATECKFQKVYDDVNEWCLDNLDACVGQDAEFIPRLYQNGVSLFADFYKLFGIVMEDSHCYTDLQVIDQMARMFQSVSSIVAYIFGV